MFNPPVIVMILLQGIFLYLVITAIDNYAKFLSILIKLDNKKVT